MRFSMGWYLSTRNRLNPNTPNFAFGLSSADENSRIGLNENQLGFWTAYNHRSAPVPPNPLDLRRPQVSNCRNNRT